MTSAPQAMRARPWSAHFFSGCLSKKVILGFLDKSLKRSRQSTRTPGPKCNGSRSSTLHGGRRLPLWWYAMERIRQTSKRDSSETGTRTRDAGMTGKRHATTRCLKGSLPIRSLILGVVADEHPVAMERQEGPVRQRHHLQPRLPGRPGGRTFSLGSAGETRMPPSSSKEMKPRSKSLSYWGRISRPLCEFVGSAPAFVALTRKLVVGHDEHGPAVAPR